ncbi:MAG TPA: transposase, partial [Cytophagaceae bacterium]
MMLQLFNKSIILLILLALSSCWTHAEESGEPYDKDSIPSYTTYAFKDASPTKKNDTTVLLNSDSLFLLHQPNMNTNVADDPNIIIWLNFKFQTASKKDYVISFLPYYRKVTFYYFNRDSILCTEVVDSNQPFTRRKYFSNSWFVDLPSNSINNYYIKYEFTNYFKFAAFEVKTYSELFNNNFKIQIIYTILFTSIILIFFLAVIFFLMNKEVQYLYYGFYALCFGFFAASCLHVWYMVPALNFISHSTFIYYIPFSLATVFFSLYILKSLKHVGKDLVVKILYCLLAIKLLTVLLACIDLEILEVWTDQYFSRIDVIIYGILLLIMVDKTKRSPQLINYWLSFGVLVMLIGQVLHIVLHGNLDSIFSFMCFDIVWFGIGLSINFRSTKNEKIKALNEVIEIKNNYNKELQYTVEQRTLQLQDNLKMIDELNNILQAHNLTLSKNVATLEQERILNKELSFEEFKSQFPDKETCLQLLVNLKWNGKFLCNVCGHTEYFQIKKTDPYLRKCAQCSRIHSGTTNTLFHNIKFPLEKAFYIVFLSTSGKRHSVESISQIISLRAGTIRIFKRKVEETMEA